MKTRLSITEGFILPEDIPHLVAMDKRSVEGTQPFSTDEFRAYLDKDTSFGLLALSKRSKKRAIVGYCLMKSYDDFVLVNRMVVESSDRHRMVATQMVERMYNFSKKINILVPERCDSLIYFLKKLNFKAKVYKKDNTLYLFNNFS